MVDVWMDMSTNVLYTQKRIDSSIYSLTLEKNISIFNYKENLPHSLKTPDNYKGFYYEWVILLYLHISIKIEHLGQENLFLSILYHFYLYYINTLSYIINWNTSRKKKSRYTLSIVSILY